VSSRPAWGTQQDPISKKIKAEGLATISLFCS
jgi:hypothetical protein